MTEIIEILDDLEGLGLESASDRAKQILSCLDVDGDGSITFEEFQKVKNIFCHNWMMVVLLRLGKNFLKLLMNFRKKV